MKFLALTAALVTAVAASTPLMMEDFTNDLMKNKQQYTTTIGKQEAPTCSECPNFCKELSGSAVTLACEVVYCGITCIISG